MKKLNIIIIILALVGGFTACNDQLDVINPNNQTTFDFGDSEAELQEAVISCYNRIRLEGTFARVGYTMDAVRGDEVWNSSQQWYLEYDNLNSPGTIEIGDQWIWRDNYHVVNRTNFVLSKVDGVEMSEESYN
ncbi:MAG: RagB/SusD family nutrient uptake outer membrane protein, partial [Prolixibacteraceae bacterium]|nr:RagB/SusD family nutrient uptake outer membrane protein [Prolixibacteraceae bacterium]